MAGGSEELLFGFNPNAIDIERSVIAIADAKVQKKSQICKLMRRISGNFILTT